MRTVLLLVVVSFSSLAGCSLYFDGEGEHNGKLGGPGPDAGTASDGGCAPSSCSDGGIDCCVVVDGGSYWPDGSIEDGGSWHPDGGWLPDAEAVDAGAPDAL